MKQISTLIGILFVSLLISSCENRNSLNVSINIEDTPIYKEYHSSKMPIKEVVNIGNFFIIDSFLVSKNIREDSLFMVFNLNTYQCISSWGVKGRGPDEYGSFTHTLRLDNDKFQIADFSQMKIYTHTIPSFSIEETVRINYGDSDDSVREIPQDIETVDGITYYYLNLQKNIISINKWSPDTDPQIINTFTFLGESYNTPFPYFGCLAINQKLGRIAYAYNYIRRFDILDLDGTLVKSIEINPSPKPPSEENNEFDILGSTWCYKGIRSYQDYFFLLYIGKTGNEIMANPNDIVVFIEQYDWDGNPIRRYQLNGFISDFDIVWDGEDIQSFVGIDPLGENSLLQFSGDSTR